MQLCKVDLLLVSKCGYLQNLAGNGAKTSFLGEKSLYFQICLLSFEDIKNRRPPQDVPCKAA